MGATFRPAVRYIYMMVAALMFCLLCPQDAVFTDKDAEEAVRKMKADFEGASIEKRIAAVQEALKIEHERVIRAVGDLFVKEPNPIRVAAARALAEADHPASAEVLLKALAANQNRVEVFPEIVKALGALGYQSACPPLHELVKKSGDPDVLVMLPEVIDALGALGSLTSVDPLIDFLRKMEGRRNPWVNEAQLRVSTDRALAAITGQAFRRSLDWDNYWRQNAEFLKAGVTRTYWLRKSQGRIDVNLRDKTPPDSVFVAARAVPVQAKPAEDPQREARREARRKRRER